MVALGMKKVNLFKTGTFKMTIFIKVSIVGSNVTKIDKKDLCL